MTHHESNWLDIFKNEAVKQIIYLVIFVGAILGMATKFDSIMGGKYAAASELNNVKEDLETHEKENVYMLEQINSQLREIRGYVILINKRGS